MWSWLVARAAASPLAGDFPPEVKARNASRCAACGLPAKATSTFPHACASFNSVGLFHPYNTLEPLDHMKPFFFSCPHENFCIKANLYNINLVPAEATPRDGSFFLFGGLKKSCSGRRAPRDGSFSFFGGLKKILCRQNRPTRSKFFPFRGAENNLCRTDSPTISGFLPFRGALHIALVKNSPTKSRFLPSRGALSHRTCKKQPHEMKTFQKSWGR